MSTPFVCFDIGSDTLKMALFAAEKDSVVLQDFAVVNLAVPPDTPLEERNTVIAQSMRFMLDEHKIKLKSVHISLSGQSVFVRFVKLPAVEESKITQIVRYEAQQQVPFPIDEVEWDHQVIGDSSGDEIDIVLVAIKNEVVAGLVEAIRKQHVEVETVDVSALALYNMMMYTAGPFEASTVLVDLGARTTDLIVAEGINLWSRSIPIGGENFSQAIAKELGISTEEADKLKRLVSIAPGEPENADENVRRASAATATVFNRLLAEIRRSIGYYRTQAQGSPVQRILISGGGSCIKGVSAFLAEKLKAEVTELSPLSKISVAPGLDSQAVQGQERLLGDVVGLGLRAAGRGMMSVNLIPKAIAYQRELSKKKVFIVGAAACLIATVVLWGLDAKTKAARAGTELDDLRLDKNKLSGFSARIKKVQGKIKKIEGNTTEVEKIQAARLYWVDFIETIKREKPDYAWITSIILEGIEDPGNTLKGYTGPSTGRMSSGYGGMPGPGANYGSMPGPGAGYGSMPGSGLAPSRGPSRIGGSKSSYTGTSSMKGGPKPKVKLEGYLKITKSGSNPEGLLATQVDNLRAALEGNRYFNNVTVLDQVPIKGSAARGEKLAKFTFEAELDVPFEF